MVEGANLTDVTVFDELAVTLNDGREITGEVHGVELRGGIDLNVTLVTATEAYRLIKHLPDDDAILYDCAVTGNDGDEVAAVEPV